MDIEKLQEDWEELGRTDPLWAIMTTPGKRGGKWNPEEFFRTGAHEIGLVMEYIGSLGVSVVRNSALDFGCGVGRLTQALATHFEHVTGVDLADSMIEQAKALNRHGDRCTYLVNAAPDLAVFGDEQFDFVYSNITLQHMPRRFMRGYLREFLRVLEPDGLLVFELTERPPPALLVKRFLIGIALAVLRRRGRMRMYWMPRRAVVSFLERHGARVIDVKETRRIAGGWARFRYCVARTPRGAPA